MSKVGERQITIPAGITVELKDNTVVVKGSSGEIRFDLPEGIVVEQQENIITFKRKKEDRKTKSLHGLFRSLIANTVAGFEKPWEKKLEIVGTGYNVKLEGENLVFKVGYSHPVIFKKVPGINFRVEGNNKIVVSGFDKHLVGQVAYQIKMIKKPDVYKGKGIRYEGEKLRIKPGKKAKAAGA